MATREGEFITCLRQEGLDLPRLARQWKRLTRAVKRTPVIHNGRVVSVFVDKDNAVRLRAVDRLTEAMGGYPARRVDISASFRVEQLHELAVRLDALPPERLLALADGVAEEPEDGELIPAATHDVR